MTSSTTAIIIGRAGSEGVPGKNARVLAGHPVVAYSIEHARAAESVDETILTTDGPDIADAARALGVRVIDRPPELATATATVAATVAHAVRAASIAADTIVVLYANVPVRPPGLIDRAIRTLHSTGADSVQSYARIEKQHPYWMMQLGDEGVVTPFIENDIDRRQDLPPLWLPDGGVLAVRRALVEQHGSGTPHAFLGSDRRGVETRSDDVIDIDTPADLARAEYALTHARRGASL